jgi:putative DNA primase/helicase
MTDLSNLQRAALRSVLNDRLNLLDYLFNDHGNAQRLIAKSGQDLKYCHAMKKWLVWDGMRWAVDDTDQARKLAKEALLEFFRQAADSRNQDAERFARGSLDARRVTSMLSMAECEIFVRPGELDANPYLLNFIKWNC